MGIAKENSSIHPDSFSKSDILRFYHSFSFLQYSFFVLSNNYTPHPNSGNLSYSMQAAQHPSLEFKVTEQCITIFVCV